MPYLTKHGENGQPPTGKTVRKNFVHIECKWDGGRSVFDTRVNDEIEFIPETSKWKVKRLYPGVGADNLPLSHIKRFKDHWNAFNRGHGDVIIGTPLEDLFADDPARIEFYKAYSIKSLEQLEALSETDFQNLGMGAREDQKRTERYFAKLRANAPLLANQAKFDELATMLKHKDAQIEELKEKLTEVLKAQIEAAPSVIAKRGRPAKVKEEDLTGIEGA
jgi:hypothetical protein